MNSEVLEGHGFGLSDDSVDQMLMLAERLREQNGGVLDDAAIQAVAEATGAPLDYVRLAVKLRSEKQKKNWLENGRAQYLTLDPDVRRYVVSGACAAGAAFLLDLEAKSVQIGATLGRYGILGMVALVFVTAALYNVAVARDSKVAAIGGAIFGGGYFALNAVFSFALQIPTSIDSILLVPCAIGGAICGLITHGVVSKYRAKLGLKDPIKERQDLLRQLVDLQDRLKSGEQSITFVSIDIVGSTRMKAQADPLAVEFTFNEYHQFVDRITRKHGGRVHSTAGDGVIAAFDRPSQAVAAAKNVQTEIFELNKFRNQIGIPIVLRCGVHTGRVVAPQAGNITSVNFAHVIDIASHLQKVCVHGGVAISDATAMSLPGGATAVGTERVRAEDVAGTVWMLRAVAPGGEAQSPHVSMD